MNQSSHQTLQYQLIKKFYEKLNNKEWLPGQMIPSEKEICEEYNVSRITVREALKELVQAGYLVRKQGKGTFVSTPTVEYASTSTFSLSEQLEAQGLQSEFVVLHFEIEPSTSSHRTIFKIGEEDNVVSIIRLRKINGKPYAYEEALVPEKYLQGATSANIDQAGLYQTIKACSGMFPEYANETVEAVQCPDRIATIMGLQFKTAVFSVNRYTMASNECIEHCRSYLHGQRYNCHHTIRPR